MINKELILAKEYFYNKDYKSALKIFSKQKEYYPAGLCSLLLKKPLFARKYWKHSAHNCPASQFGLIILDIIALKYPIQSPTFFQTRAQLEVYLSLFIENELFEWAQNLVSAQEIFFKANPESYKFIARALFANGYFDFAITFCKKSLSIFYSDAEALLILSQSQYLTGDIISSKESLEATLRFASNYYPALLFKRILNESTPT